MRAVFVVACCLALACDDTVGQPTCPEGSHAEARRCVEDETTQERFTLTPNGACPLVAPESIRVRVGQDFQFENKDSAAHTIRGTSDGKVWLELEPAKLSPFTSISKAGTWGFEVSACGSRGTVIVE